VGEEKSIPKSDPAELKNSLDTEGAQSSATVDGEATLDTAASLAAAAQALGSIGPYVFVKKLGEGGMGLVWLAEQTAPVTRQVAVKLIKGGLYDSSVIQRFESERQSLAVMNHPAIAKVFDAGSTKDGQPYFVMEYVNGPPITTYCDNKKLKIRERLELFIKVCEGVQHAHQKAVIHRDLKPSNVLVSEVDGKPLPRIIDFGIAKAISAQAGVEKTMLTQLGALVGTPGFISPEQADPSVLDVDTRTDVYSLGVILYMLLTGTLPFDQARWKKKRFDEILRELREEDPPSPSTRLRGEPETATESAAMRAIEPRQLVSMLRGDLDWITMKALEKDRARRYGSPSELAADIERYLQNRPVVARPATTGYRLKKYVQRHRAGVAAATGVAALLVAFAIAQTVQLRRITRERDRANRITSFMTGMFKVSDPNEARGNTITAREILDKAYQDIDTGLAKDPELQAQMMGVMGDVYVNLGLYGRAEPLLEKSTEIHRRVAGTKNPDTLEATDRLAYVLSLQGHYTEAEKLERETLEIRRRTLGPENAATAATIMHLGTTLGAEGHLAEAEKLQREALAIRERVLGLENTDTLNTMGNLANTLQHEGRYAEAEKLDRQTLEIRSRVLGPEHLDTVFALASLSWDLLRQGQLAEAEKLQRQAVDIRRRILGPEHPDTLASVARLAVILKFERRFADAEKLQRETLEIRQRVLGPEHPDTVLSIGSLAGTLQSEGKLDEAEKLYRQELDIDKRVFGPEHEATLGAMSDLATVLGGEERYADGEKLIREVLTIEQRALGPDSPLTANTRLNLAMFAALRGQRDEPLALLHEAIDHGLDVNSMRLIATNPNFTSLHRDPRFAALVQRAEERIAAAKKPN
jgi:serine/threonine protein kinase